jgi:hypothetical protein
VIKRPGTVAATLVPLAAFAGVTGTGFGVELFAGEVLAEVVFVAVGVVVVVLVGDVGEGKSDLKVLSSCPWSCNVVSSGGARGV